MNLLHYVISSLLNGLSDTILWALCVSASCLCPQANCFSKSDLINCAYRSIPYSHLIWFSKGQGSPPICCEPVLSYCISWAPRPAASRRRQCGRQSQQPMRHERWAVNHHPLGPSTENASLDKGEFNWQLTMNNWQLWYPFGMIKINYSHEIPGGFPKNPAIYDIFYFVPQGLLNCQLSTVNCQLKVTIQ